MSFSRIRASATRGGPGPAPTLAPRARIDRRTTTCLIDLLITPAYAQAPRRLAGGGDLMTFLPMVAIFVVFYFLLIRPQQKKAKEAKAMLEALQKGDEVVTAGGIVGQIAKLERPVRDASKSPHNVEITVQRGADRAAAAQGHDQDAVIG